MPSKSVFALATLFAASVAARSQPTVRMNMELKPVAWGPKPEDFVPQQLHLALAGADAKGDATGMTVSWHTKRDTRTSTVRYGLSPDKLDTAATGSSLSYLDEFEHHVTLPNLRANTRYYYQAGDGEGGWSAVKSFKSAPSLLSGGATYPLRIAVIGDMARRQDNAAESIDRLNAMAAKGEIDLLWHLGDISYADDDFLSEGYLQDHYEDVWNEYMTQLEPTTSAVPYMVLPGNHEAECHSPACQVEPRKANALGNYTAYNSRFRMPSRVSGGSGDDTSMWYSFAFGPLRFVSISTETNYENAPTNHYRLTGENGNFWGDQVGWLESTLAAAEASRAERPWVMVGGHRPVYSLANSAEGVPQNDLAAVQAAFEPLFNKYHVDVYWSGHEHSYERQFPVWDSINVEASNPSVYADAPYTAYIVAGAPGTPEKHTDLSKNTAPWSAAKDDSHYGIGVLTVVSESELTWQQLDSASGAVLDQVTFIRT